MKRLFLIVFLITSNYLFSQQLILSGKIASAENDMPLSYANIRIDGTMSGTSSNVEGRYELKLSAGHYKIIASYIGFKSDTAEIELTASTNLDFSLETVSIKLQEVTVLPGKNPAEELMRRVIEEKHKRDSKIDSYVFQAYTKGIVKTTRGAYISDRQVNIEIAKSDTGKLSISAIIENESRGYFKKPDFYKDEIIARKQTANAPPSINILTGGRFIQNFYSNDLRFFGRVMTSPIADEALDYYYYIITDTLAQDNRNIFVVNFEPIDRSDPGFYGDLYIIDSTYDLVKVDVNLNDAANPGGIFSKINIFQQFVPFADNIYLPIDYRLFVEGNVLGIAKFGLELTSIFNNYKINPGIDDDFFGMAVVKVMTDADKKDSTYWESIPTIPNTKEEVKAYYTLDSLKNVPHNFWDEFSPFATQLNLSDNFAISGPLDLYHFNRVEGHALDFGLYLNDAADQRLDMTTRFSYGFSDKKFKKELSSKYLLGEYRTTSFSFKAFDKLEQVFDESDEYGNFIPTLLSFFDKYEFRDYFYRKGFSFNVESEIFPVLKLGAGFSNTTDNNAFVNSDFSLFNKDKPYRTNPHIYEARINAVTASFQLDFRKYVEDGYYRRRMNTANAYVILSGDAFLSNKSFLKSDMDFRIYNLYLKGGISLFRFMRTSLQLHGVYSNEAVPYQMMYALPGNIDGSGKNFSFRTLRLGEVFGDKVVTLGVENNFGDELFRLLHVPLLKDMQILTSVHFNAAWTKISTESKAILPVDYREFEHPFYEIGFGIGHPLFPLRVEFTWRLNYPGKENFVIGVNTPFL